MKYFASLLLAMLIATLGIAQYIPSDSLIKLRQQRALELNRTQVLPQIQPFSAIINPIVVPGSIEVNRNPVYASYTPKELVEKIFIGSGSCSVVENITYVGGGWDGSNWVNPNDGRSIGYFHKGSSNFPLTEGIIMSTGQVGLCEGANVEGLKRAGSNAQQTIGDADLHSLLTDQSLLIQNVAILEFDFTPVGNTLEFRYVFASEEYPEFVYASYNDVFGFFISEELTPSIKENIALLPTTETSTKVVCIDNVNNGYKLFNTDLLPGNNPVNTSYFITNLDGSPTTEFDGYTTVLTARASVNPCKKYHLKLAIGNVSDMSFDSGVFLEARSFNVGASLVNYTNGIEGKNEVFEGCGPNMLSIRRVGDISASQMVTLTYSGTAVNGVDFNLPTSVMFSAGESAINIPYTVIDNGISDNGRYIDIGIDCPCAVLSSYTHRITIYEPAALNPLTTSCGSITASMTGGSGIYEYSIDGGVSWQSSSTFLGLTAGSYTVMGRDVGSCHTKQQTITASDAVNITVATTDMLCPTPNRGVITITATNGVAPYEYSINNGASWQASNTFINLRARTYMVMVRDANGCEALTFASITRPNPIEKEAMACSNMVDGSINISTIGGTPPYLYSIDDGVTWGASSSFPSLPFDTYKVAVKDANGCKSTTTTRTISATPTLSHSITTTNVSCGGISDGSITISATGGTSSYWYSIDGEITTQSSNTFSNLAAGTYTVVTIDSNDCKTSSTITIGASTSISIALSHTNTTCNGSANGSITVTASGGSGVYEYSKDGGTTWQASNAFIGLAAGTYAIAVKDNAGCLSTATQVVADGASTLSLTATSTDATCNGTANGTITITAVGGIAPYQYSVDGGTTWQSGANFTTVAAGTHTVMVKDNNGCTASITETITEPTPVLVTNVTYSNIPCKGGSVNVVITATGGSGMYTHYNVGSSISASPTVSIASGGTYQVKVKDSKGCMSANSYWITITEPATAPSITATPSYTCSAATIAVAGSGGTPPYQYSPTAPISWTTSTTFAGVTSGTYTFMVKDANGCQAFSSPVTVTLPTPLSLTATAIGGTCAGNDGAITAAPANGTAPYQFSIDGGTTWQASPTFTGISAGTYTIKVQDASTCIASTSVTVAQLPSTLSLTATATGTTCLGNDGTITATAAGGIAPYQYSIDGGTTWQNSNTLTGIADGAYTIQVKDANTCIASTSVTVTQLPSTLSLTATSTNTTCDGVSDGTITATTAGGAAPYRYSVDGGTTWQTSSTFTSLSENTYTLTVEDTHTCQATATVNVGANTVVITPTILHSHVQCSNGADGMLTLNALGGSGTYEYSIDNGQTFNSLNTHGSLTAGDYNIVVKDSNGCLSVPQLASITEPEPIKLVFDITDNTCKAIIDISSTTGGSGGYQYSIDKGANWQTMPTFSNLSESMYTIQVKDINGCEAAESVSLRIDYQTILPDKLPNYKTSSPYNVQLETSAIPPYSFTADNGFPQWLQVLADGKLNGTPTGAENKLYTLTVKLVDANGCEVIKVYDLSGELFIPEIITPNNDGKNDHFMKGYRIIVYDRLGTKIFEGNDGWDGTRKGKVVVPDTYFYVLFDGDTKKQGSISVITQ